MKKTISSTHVVHFDGVFCSGKCPPLGGIFRKSSPSRCSFFFGGRNDKVVWVGEAGRFRRCRKCLLSTGHISNVDSSELDVLVHRANKAKWKGGDGSPLARKPNPKAHIEKGVKR